MSRISLPTGFFSQLWMSFGVAMNMIRLHKLRAFLTMLGVIIGVMAVTLIVMISNGFQSFLKNEFQKLGADTIIIAYDSGFGGPRRVERNSKIDGLYLEDVQMLQDRVQTLDLVSGAVMIPGQRASTGEREISGTEVNGVDANFAELNRFGVSSGRKISDADVANRTNVAVIGPEIAERLFPGRSALGEMVTVGPMTLEVVGVAEKVEIMGQNNGKDVLIPLTTAQDKWTGDNRLAYITTRPREGVTVQRAMDDAWAALMQKSDNKRVYRLDSRESILGVLGSIVGVAGAALAGVAALALLVGGIGIMNIMLVSVTERTREIGLRKSLGARRSTILTQFLVEAALLGVVGGTIGMGVAWVLGQVVTFGTRLAKIPSEAGLQMAFPVTAAIGALVFSALIGVVFGLYPAARASALSPIEALRTE